VSNSPETAAAPSARVKVKRHPERATYERESVHAILDEALVCHLGFVDGGVPLVIPTIHARLGDSVYVHGAPASRMLREAAAAPQVCLTVTLVDGLVLARSAFNHSLNYRSVVLLGSAERVTDRDEKMAASEALVEHVCRGRWAEARWPTEKELGATVVLRMELEEVSAKVRSGPPKDDFEDLDRPVWAGVVPLRTVPLAPEDDPAMDPALAVPGYAAHYVRPGWEPDTYP
jgi:nitroimidazol reductase NimA-like FMN-containing flavoprotein (pyridoxamine 5'-phosphate oxidase superfamily)